MEIAGHKLPTVPPGKMDELQEFMRRVEASEPVLAVETTRLQRDGEAYTVQFSLRPFRERDGPVYFLEATSDIRARALA